MLAEQRKNFLISVIVPVYNVETYLEKCITSIVKQTYCNLEIILVDDGSQDRCGEICDIWASKDKRIRVIHQENRGLSAARNVGIENSAGEYICFIDSDDYVEPEMLEQLLIAIKKKNAEIAVCNFTYEYEQRYLDNGGTTYKAEDYQIKEDMLLSGREILILMDHGKYTFCEVAWNKLYRKALFSQLRYPLGKIHEDEFVFHRLIYPCSQIVCIPYVGYHYLQRSSSIIHGGRKNQDIIEAFLDRCQFLLDKDEKELCITNEGRLLSFIKRAEKTDKKVELLEFKKHYFSIVCQMYKKRWLSLYTLCKRFVRCRIL